MGLLDGLFGGAASGGGAAMIEQLVVSALQNQGGAQAQQGGGGMLGSLLGSLGGGAAAGGGLQGIVSAFEQNGMGHIAQSWVGDGENHPVSPDQVQTAFGDDKVQAIADQTGLPKEDVLSHLAQMLPGIVDRLTQGGRIPT
jgi:uncharacterized protein YidB (DUF937 family)